MNTGGALTTSPARSRYRVRVQNGERVVPGLHHFIQITDRARLDRARERTVVPADVAAREREATDQVGAGQIVVAADRDHRAVE